ERCEGRTQVVRPSSSSPAARLGDGGHGSYDRTEQKSETDQERPNMEIKGKIAVVVGGASGMARASAELLAERGATVAICDLESSAGSDVAKEIGGGTTFHPIDITDFEAAEKVLDEVVETHGALHVAVNTAGGGIGKRTLSKDGPHPLDSFRQVIDLNL